MLNRAINHYNGALITVYNIIATLEAKVVRGLLQTSFSHISTNSSTILTVSMATESPWKDLSIGTSHTSKQSVLAEILGRSTGNHHGTIYQIANISETATI